MIVTVKHPIQVAHRLYNMPGKCQQIHGHSMMVSLQLLGERIGDIFEGMDFSYIKREFRTYLDNNYDHRLLLNAEDPWAQSFNLHDPSPDDPIDGNSLPGLVKIKGDPTVENLAQIIADWACEVFALDVMVTIDETNTNSVTTGATCA